MNDVVSGQASDLRMDVLSEQMVVDDDFRERILAMADELYSTSGCKAESRERPSGVSSPLGQLFSSQRGQSPPGFNLFALLPWYFWPLSIGLAVLKALPTPKLRSIRSRLPRKQDRAGDFHLDGSSQKKEWFEWGRSKRPVPENSDKPIEIRVPQEWSLDVLQSLEWRRFETVCAEHIRMTGHEPKETRIGADGGVDIWVYRPGVVKAVGIVQCKAWKSYKVGVKPVRELLGVMAKEKVAQGKFITSGEFTAEALAFVEGENLKLITGEMFLASIWRLPAEKQKALLQIAVSGDYRTPTCPQCGVKMTLRQGQGEWRDFWGCPTYPSCKATLVYKSDTV